MGLFDKKFCCICGQKAGMLTRQKLMDDYLCGDCRQKCSPLLTWREFETMSAQDAAANIEYMYQSEELFRTTFRESYTISTGIMGGTRVVSIDEINGLWVPASNAPHDVLSFDQVMGTRLDIETRHLSPDDMRKPDRPRMPMPPMGMPGCRPDEEITSMKVIVSVNHPYLREVILTVMNAVFVTEADIRAGYECAQRIFMCFEQQSRMPRTPRYDHAAHRGPVRPHAPGAPMRPVAPQAPGADPTEALKKYKELLDMGAITREEYEAKKRQLLGL